MDKAFLILFIQHFHFFCGSYPVSSLSWITNRSPSNRPSPGSFHLAGVSCPLHYWNCSLHANSVVPFPFLCFYSPSQYYFSQSLIPTLKHLLLFFDADACYPRVFTQNWAMHWSVHLSAPVQFSRVWLFATPWIAACQASLSITNSRSSARLTSIESVMPSSQDRKSVV